MARILVNGAMLRVGRDRLLDDGHDLLCVDNYFTGSKRNIAHRLDHPYFELMRHDVTFPLYVEVDQIYNLACPASPVHYQHDPVQTTKTSVHGANAAPKPCSSTITASTTSTSRSSASSTPTARACIRTTAGW